MILLRKIMIALVLCAVTLAVTIPHNIAMADHHQDHAEAQMVINDHDEDDTGLAAFDGCCQMAHCELVADPANSVSNFVQIDTTPHLFLTRQLSPAWLDGLVRPPRTV